MPAVLITTVDGTTDYCIEGDVQVLHIDFDRYDLDRSFPGDVDIDIAQLRLLPDMPWKTETIRRLTAKRLEIATAIRSELPPGDDPVEAD